MRKSSSESNTHLANTSNAARNNAVPDAHAAGAAERPEAAGAAERPESAAKRKHQQMVATLKSTPANRDDLDVIPQKEPEVPVSTRGTDVSRLRAIKGILIESISLKALQAYCSFARIPNWSTQTSKVLVCTLLVAWKHNLPMLQQQQDEAAALRSSANGESASARCSQCSLVKERPFLLSQ